jgi:type I restriction enzyme M protein
MVKIEKAGINTIGQEIENELIPVEEEFTKYRNMANLWNDAPIKYEYRIKDNNQILRQLVGINSVPESEVFYVEKNYDYASGKL